MWTATRYAYKDTEGQKLTVESNEEGSVIIEAKEGVFFETEQDALDLLDKLKEKIESLFDELH